MGQTLKLSAGVPFTSANFFTWEVLAKELTAGNFDALPAFIRSNIDRRSVRFFREKRDILQKIAQEGFDLGQHIGTYGQGYQTFAEKFGNKSFKEKAGIAFNEAFDRKTFGSFMPQLYVNTFEGAYKSALKNGLTEQEARRIAGESLEAFNGMTKELFRSGATKDKLSAAFFASKFREGILGSLYGTGKAGLDFVQALGGLRRPLDPALKSSRRLIAGLMLTYGAYNVINEKLNGHAMWDNPKGHRFQIQIPRKDGTLIYVDYMPIFQSTVKNLVGIPVKFAKGDWKGSVRHATSLLSMPVQSVTQIMTNQDYFGNPIWKDTDTLFQKGTKIAKYLGLEYNHPWVQETINQIEGKKPLYQSVVAAVELPLKFSSLSTIEQNQFYDAQDKIAKENARAKENVQPEFNKFQELMDQGNTDEAQKVIDSLSDEDYKIFENIYTSYKTQNTKARTVAQVGNANKVAELVATGKADEAQKIIDGLSDDDYDAFEKAYKVVTSKKEEPVDDSSKPSYKPGEKIDKHSFIKDVSLYARSIGTDPLTAFNRIISGQRIVRLDNGTIIVERLPFKESTAIKKARGSGTEMKLDHTLPLEIGGSNAQTNLVLIPTEQWASYTQVENQIAKLLKSEKMTKKEAQREILSFKSSYAGVTDPEEFKRKSEAELEKLSGKYGE